LPAAGYSSLPPGSGERIWSRFPNHFYSLFLRYTHIAQADIFSIQSSDCRHTVKDMLTHSTTRLGIYFLFLATICPFSNILSFSNIFNFFTIFFYTNVATPRHMPAYPIALAALVHLIPSSTRSSPPCRYIPRRPAITALLTSTPSARGITFSPFPHWCGYCSGHASSAAIELYNCALPAPHSSFLPCTSILRDPGEEANGIYLACISIGESHITGHKRNFA
jgi:hypothetical protein